MLLSSWFSVLLEAVILEVCTVGVMLSQSCQFFNL